MCIFRVLKILSAPPVVPHTLGDMMRLGDTPNPSAEGPNGDFSTLSLFLNCQNTGHIVRTGDPSGLPFRDESCRDR